ncbi:MATE family efflux transporter [Robertkochia sediminum]|uniref:MATE family efflux transporter n=1 Tax=Robertkochia sediminum TaxID=2785326 RepID=UPI001931D359|nr:MATE family efflux transporter [Robertkochia sediminum]MBL7472640.1 MATE family efflux transporter [Robertkochia sediminum]
MLKNYTREFAYNLRLAAPVILGMLGHTFVGFADNVMVGQLGTAQLAAVSLGNSFVFIAMSLGIGFTTAITPLVAEADGSGDVEKGRLAFSHGLVLSTIIGIALFLVVLLGKPLMDLMKQPDEVVALALPYLDIVALSLVPLVMFQALKQFSDGLSMTKYPMYVTVVANVVNIVLNYLLIFGKFGFPQLGIIGAGIGTLVSRVLLVLLLWRLLKSRKRIAKYLEDIQFFKLKRTMVKKVFDLGFPSALQMFFEVGIFTAAVWLSGVLGKNPQAANQIALNLSSMTYMVGVGLSVAAMVRVGNQKGLKDFSELRRIAFSVFFLTFLIMTIFATSFVVFRDWLPTLYLDQNDMINLVDNSEVISIASQLLLIAAIFQISDGFQVVFLGALRGLQDVKLPTVITFIAYWVVGFPISYFLGLHFGLGNIGIWIGLLSGLTVAAVFLYFRFNYLTKKLIAGEQVAIGETN